MIAAAVRAIQIIPLDIAEVRIVLASSFLSWRLTMGLLIAKMHPMTGAK
jgi:hypothetical protein